MDSRTGLPSGVVYHGPKYLWKIAELEENAIAKLGSMDEGSFEQFNAKMIEIATRLGISNPVMGIGIKFKPGAHSFVDEQTYPITKAEWVMFRNDAKTMCEYMPKVYVVDGLKFKLPI
jgi:hypothetical protein